MEQLQLKLEFTEEECDASIEAMGNIVAELKRMQAFPSELSSPPIEPLPN
jgi:hypothetical protein